MRETDETVETQIQTQNLQTPIVTTVSENATGGNMVVNAEKSDPFNLPSPATGLTDPKLSPGTTHTEVERVRKIAVPKTKSHASGPSPYHAAADNVDQSNPSEAMLMANHQ